MKRSQPSLQLIVVRAPSVDAKVFEARLASILGEATEEVRVVEGPSADSIDAIDVALAKPGTITLELVLQGCPMVVAGRIHPFTARIVRRTLRAQHTSMPNLLAGEAIVPECIQEQATPERIATELAPLFDGAERGRQTEGLVTARARLGSQGAATRGAQIVEEMLGHSSA